MWDGSRRGLRERAPERYRHAMADEDPPLPPPTRKLDLLREAGFELTPEGLADAGARLDRAAEPVTPEARAESRERVREIMGAS